MHRMIYINSRAAEQPVNRWPTFTNGSPIMKSVSASLLLSTILAGCAAPVPLTPEQVKQMESPICTTNQNQCSVMWQKAQLWIVQNSAWKIQMANDTVLQTFGPGDSTAVAYTITKEPMAADTYQIRMRAACGNMFGCLPKSPSVAIMEFNSFLKQ